MYRAVLEPYALAEMLQYFAWDSFGGARAARGAKLLHRAARRARLRREGVASADDALDPRGLPKAFDFEGVAEAARDARRERRRARRRLGSAQRRSAPAATSRHGTRAAGRRSQAYGPLPFALSLAGGEAESVDDLVAAVDDGIYITRVHYLGIVDPRRGVLTGMTRDGTFRIRDGKIAEPLVNLRFTVAVPDLLADVPALTRERDARQPERLLRRALPVRRARAGDRDRALQRHGQSARRPGI